VFDDSEFEQSLFALRQEKLKEIVKLGQAAYPNRFPSEQEAEAITIPQVREQWGEATAEALEAPRVTVAVAGRIMAIRAQGKAGFATLQQGGQRLQIYVRLDAVGEQGFALYKLLDLGDHIGVTGYLFRTRTGELTVHVETLTFLSKAAFDKGVHHTLGLSKQAAFVSNCRAIGKRDMVHNDYVPKVEVAPETYTVKADGEVVTCEPASELPLTQRYFLF